MITHQLKTWIPFFQDILDGRKTFEVRKNDRDFHIGDTLILLEVDPHNNLTPTGRDVSKEVVYILSGENWGLQPGYVVLGIKAI